MSRDPDKALIGWLIGTLDIDVDHGVTRPKTPLCAEDITEIGALKPTILVIEDDKAVRDSLRMVLELYGYEVDEYSSGEELLAHGVQNDGACVILDVNLPGANGLNVLEKLRAMDNPVPAIVVSGRATEEVHAQAKRLNALAFFDKPIDIDALIAVLGSISN
ncbi:response regulator [Chelativorans xinjiangense]|uniref:response regulator n=1 Tax=Chelativorans xinjiangense TaxID=2681485 RepID=UPI00135712C4|nr:response regulator [Chelativorans xinjiangense]